MKSLKEYVRDAEERKIAIGHFNISNSEGLEAIWRAARKLNVPVIIGVSEGERDFVGVERTAAMVKSLREEHDFPIFLNADHTYSFERVKEVLDLGFDAAIFDGAKLPLEENIAAAKKCVEYAKSLGRDVLIEGEVGYIGQSSKILDKIPEGVDTKIVTDPEEAKHFVTETGVDMLAPAVGNFHGKLRQGDEPIDPEAIKNIREAAGVPLVLHGGSGISDADFIKAIDAGIAIIHINTELRAAFRKGLEEGLAKSPDEIAPYKYLVDSVEEMEKVAEARLKLFNKL